MTFDLSKQLPELACGSCWRAWCVSHLPLLTLPDQQGGVQGRLPPGQLHLPAGPLPGSAVHHHRDGHLRGRCRSTHCLPVQEPPLVASPSWSSSSGAGTARGQLSDAGFHDDGPEDLMSFHRPLLDEWGRKPFNHSGRWISREIFKKQKNRKIKLWKTLS